MRNSKPKIKRIIPALIILFCISKNMRTTLTTSTTSKQSTSSSEQMRRELMSSSEMGEHVMTTIKTEDPLINMYMVREIVGHIMKGRNYAKVPLIDQSGEIMEFSLKSPKNSKSLFRFLTTHYDEDLSKWIAYTKTEEENEGPNQKRSIENNLCEIVIKLAWQDLAKQDIKDLLQCASTEDFRVITKFSKLYSQFLKVLEKEHEELTAETLKVLTRIRKTDNYTERKRCFYPNENTKLLDRIEALGFIPNEVKDFNLMVRECGAERLIKSGIKCPKCEKESIFVSFIQARSKDEPATRISKCFLCDYQN